LVTDLRIVAADDGETTIVQDIMAILDAQVSHNRTISEYVNAVAGDVLAVKAALTVALGALTEQLDKAATRDDLNTLRSELLALIGAGDAA
jgi:hypothetical protein